MINTLLRERQFSILLGGNLLSRIGDGVHEFIFIITVLQVTNNGVVDAGAIYFVRFIPYLALGPIGGALSDRLSRRSLMLGADLARMLITALFCGLLVTGQIGPLLLALLGMLMTAFRTIFQPAFQSTVPALVRPENLPAANGGTQIAGEIGGLIGPALGAALLALISSPGHVLLVDAATYLISALCVTVVRIPADHLVEKDAAKPMTLMGLYADFGQNLKEVVATPQLLIAIVYSSACILFVGAALRILLPAMMRSAGYSDSMVGYAMSLTALGAIGGAWLCSRLVRDFSTRSLMLYWCLYGLALAVLPACVASAAAVLCGWLALGVFGAYVDVVLATNIQQQSTKLNIGKNFSLFSTLANTGEALSGGFAGMLVLLSSVSVSVTVIGILIAAVAYVGKYKSGDQNG